MYLTGFGLQRNQENIEKIFKMNRYKIYQKYNFKLIALKTTVRERNGCASTCSGIMKEKTVVYKWNGRESLVRV